MKTARFVLKIVAYSLAGAAAVCAVIGYWPELMRLFRKLCPCKEKDIVVNSMD